MNFLHPAGADRGSSREGRCCESYGWRGVLAQGRQGGSTYLRIAHDIRNQYTIVYVPTNKKQDGSYRVVEVKAGARDRGRLLVRTRAGYYAPQ